MNFALAPAAQGAGARRAVLQWNQPGRGFSSQLDIERRDADIIGDATRPPPLAVGAMTAAPTRLVHFLGDEDAALDAQDIVEAVVDIRVTRLGRVHRRAEHTTIRPDSETQVVLFTKMNDE